MQSRRILLIAAAVLSIFLMAACGVKGLPKAPAQKLPPLVSGLEVKLADGRAVLTWPIPVWEDASDELTGFTVLRSVTPISELDCNTCPVQYEQVASPHIQPEDAGRGTMTYSERLEKGYRYEYKVSAYSEDGVNGKASKPKSVIY